MSDIDEKFEEAFRKCRHRPGNQGYANNGLTMQDAEKYIAKTFFMKGYMARQDQEIDFWKQEIAKKLEQE